MFEGGNPTHVHQEKDAIIFKVMTGSSGREDSRKNDVIVCHGSTIDRHIVLFPGDVQDYRDSMLKHRDNHRWARHNLEDTARRVHRRFPCACVWVIRACKLHLNTFACYGNFVTCNMFGVPSYSHTEVTALSQTAHLLDQCIRSHFEDSFHKELLEKPVAVVGFSKGCSVLNQMLHEWNLLSSSPNNCQRTEQFSSNITHLCWLDSGNCGHSGAWVTDSVCLTAVPQEVCFHVHTTPYQTNDKFRPWIGEEHATFVDHLKNNSRKHVERIHFEDEEPSLENHFKLLRSFGPQWDEGDCDDCEGSSQVYHIPIVVPILPNIRPLELPKSSPKGGTGY